MASSRMLALLGLLAVAGYQNRDKLGEMFGNLTDRGKSDDTPNAPSQGGIGGLLGGLFGSGTDRSEANAGLGDLIENFTGSGHAETAQSWVKDGPNKEILPNQLGEALGAETLDALAKQTGLSREDILSRLSAVLPTAVDKMTPDGRLPG